ncbi:ATP-binding protein [Marilutibacter alkalisoli]|uniref:histidine kinase n=1 Tax=Marilutibacter alkalisoli TaxID=2591633 RepID=A0A514BPK2_9GAMM|nr:ATP-binding protein [Lysobacter alkalisoli]QDH69311.1 response regulator [Lysobacter alkalisoli]
MDQGRHLRWLTGLALAAWLGAIASVHAGLPERPRLQQVTVADGLPSNRVNALAEGHDGYLWVATSDGLGRYDGAGFKVWRAEDGLGDDFLWSVFVDRDNRVWVGTDRAGLVMFDSERKQWRRYRRADDPRIGSDAVWSVTGTDDGTIWFGTDGGGLHRLDTQGRITRFTHDPDNPDSLPSDEVNELVVAPDGHLWVGTRGGAARWTGRDFERVPADALPSPIINEIGSEADGTIWFGTPRGIGLRTADGRYLPGPWAQEPYELKVLNVLASDRNGQYWLDIPKGLGLARQDESVQVVPLYSEMSQGLIRPSWQHAYRDREGGLWLASNGHGLWYLPATWRQFSVLTSRIDDPESLGNADVRGIAPARGGDMWLVGGSGVLDRLDPESGRVEHVLTDFSEGYVTNRVMEDSTGAVWIGYYGGLVRYEPDSRRLQRWNAGRQEDLLSDGISRFVFDREDRLWLVAHDGRLQARDMQGRVTLTLAAGDPRGLPADVTSEQVGTGPAGLLWVATDGGVLQWNDEGGRLEPVPGTPTTHVYAFGADSARDQVWLAQEGGRLESFAWDGAGLQLQARYDYRDGLPRVAANGLIVDRAGIVWLTSERGLVRLDPETRSVRVYGVRDGLPSQEYRGLPVARPADGRILLGSAEGVVVFDPAVVRPQEHEPNLHVESIQVRHHGDWVELPGQGGFKLQHDDGDLKVVARLLSFHDARSHVHRSRLVGYDSDWIETGINGERLFPRLPSGQYRLELSARTADNVWSPTRVVEFEVLPPWWRTWGALAGFVGLATLLLWWAAEAYRERLRQQHARARAEHEREIAQQASLAKTRFLATLGHEVRTPMTGVLGMSELLLGTRLDPDQRSYAQSIKQAGEHLLRLVNDALDLARIESGRLELVAAPFDLRKLLAEVTGLNAPLARGKGLEFVTDVEPGLPVRFRGDVNRVTQILLNLLGNAIKFTEVGRVSLKVGREAGGALRFVIEDTGPGMSEEQQVRLFRRFEQAEGGRTAARYGGSGLGLAISQELAEAMGGRIEIDSAPGRGARFRVVLPLPAETGPAAVDEAPAADHTLRPLSVLLVEDDPTVADVLTGLLQAQGHRVIHVEHGLAALVEATSAGGRGSGFDVALLDLDLPGMDGMTLAQQLRTQGFEAPLVAVTARADAEVEDEAMQAGFERFVRKPLTGAMLAEVLEDVDRPGRVDKMSTQA